MDDAVAGALSTDRIVDITTTGRQSGQPRRIEIWLLDLDGRYFITGTPGQRDWLANLRANPELTVHLKQAVERDLRATARPVTDEPTRHQVLTHAETAWYRGQASLDDLMARSPLVELTFVDG
jgi:deazaflavin-dependent oxidoreductase (nitroreductase family)